MHKIKIKGKNAQIIYKIKIKMKQFLMHKLSI